MKPLLLILALTVSASAQTTTHDPFTNTTVTASKQVRLYRNSGGLLVYFPDEVSATVFTSPNAVTVLALRVNSFRWQFTRDCKVYFIADGERTVLPCELATHSVYSLRRNVYVRETITVKEPGLTKILRAKELLMRVGSYEFKVKEKDLKTLRKVLPDT